MLSYYDGAVYQAPVPAVSRSFSGRQYPTEAAAFRDLEFLAVYSWYPYSHISPPAVEPWQTARIIDYIWDSSKESVVPEWQVINEPLADYRARRKKEVNKKREQHCFPGVVSASLADGTVVQADLRFTADLKNLSNLYSRAMRLDSQGETVEVMGFRDAGNVSHSLTPQDMIRVAEAALSHEEAVYQQSWTHKDALDSKTSYTSVHDYDINSGWPS